MYAFLRASITEVQRLLVCGRQIHPTWRSSIDVCDDSLFLSHHTSPPASHLPHTTTQASPASPSSPSTLSLSYLLFPSPSFLIVVLFPFVELSFPSPPFPPLSSSPQPTSPLLPHPLTHSHATTESSELSRAPSLRAHAVKSDQLGSAFKLISLLLKQVRTDRPQLRLAWFRDDHHGCLDSRPKQFLVVIWPSSFNRAKRKSSTIALHAGGNTSTRRVATLRWVSCSVLVETHKSRVHPGGSSKHRLQAFLVTAARPSKQQQWTRTCLGVSVSPSD